MARNNKNHSKVKFVGYQSPHYTIVPDELFDEQMVALSGAELKVLLYIIRHTYGFKRDDDNISISQMLHGVTRRDGSQQDQGCGLSKPTLLQALRDLQERNLIVTERRVSREKGNEPTNYRLNILTEPMPEPVAPPLVKKVYQGVGQETLPSPWSNYLTKQETIKQETYTSNNFEGSKDRLESRRRGEGRPMAISEILSKRGRPRSKHAPVGSKMAGKSADQGVTSPIRQPDQNQAENGASDIPPWLDGLISEFSTELHDGRSRRSNITQALRLWQGSGRSEEDFRGLLFEAHRVTRSRSSAIRKRASGQLGAFGVRNGMPFFFAVLRDLLGVESTKRSRARPDAAV